MEIKIENLTFGYKGGKNVLEDISADFSGDKLISIIGPNGVGKSTLIHCLNKILTPTSGEVYIDGVNLNDIKIKDLAKIMAYVPCTVQGSFPLSVTDAILLGRNPHSKWGSLDEDLKKVEEVMELLKIKHLSKRYMNELSAGQHQKVVLARGLVQETSVILLDEPTSNLDVRHQMEVTRILRDYAHNKNILVIMISHDLNIASKYSDEIIMLHDGKIFAKGSPSEVVNSKNISVVYGVNSETVIRNGRPHIILMDDSEVDNENGDINDN